MRGFRYDPYEPLSPVLDYFTEKDLLLDTQGMMDSLGSGEGQCMVCGDRSAGKHYGVMACYGCKGFFRRTIRSGQTYTCRFVQKCSIDKDQRNACRFCRFQRCLNVGMEPEAIRPDRDIIGKQKNPRRKKLKREDSSLPSPGSESHMSSQDDALITYLVDVELQATSGAPPMEMCSPIGIARVKSDPDFDLASLFHNKMQLSADTFDMNYDIGRVASVEQLSQSMRRYVIAAVHWIDQLFNLAHVTSIQEKVCALRSTFAAFSLFSQAARTAQTTADPDVLCLCNRAIIPRIPPRHLLETNLLANNFTARLLDDLVTPLRKLALNESELVALTALIVLDADASGLSPSSQVAVSDVRDKVQNALFQLVRERMGPESGLASVTARFGNILLILPPLAKLSSLVGENVQFAKMFGVQGIDPFLVELFVENPTGDVIPSPSAIKDRTDAQTQTAHATPPSLPSPMSSNGEPHCVSSIASSSDSLPESVAAPIAQHRPPPLVVPATYSQFPFMQYSNAAAQAPSSAPFSAPYSTPYQPAPTNGYYDGSQSADPTRLFRFN